MGTLTGQVYTIEKQFTKDDYSLFYNWMEETFQSELTEDCTYPDEVSAIYTRKKLGKIETDTFSLVIKKVYLSEPNNGQQRTTKRRKKK